MAKPGLLDAFCKAGGAGMGYHLAGFEVVGVDIEPQKNYPFEFHQADALEFITEHGHEFDVIHASPPCQFGSVQTALRYRGNHKNYIPEVRELLQRIGKPYVIENVENVRSHLVNPIKLCGSMFGLNLWRHRYFEVWPDMFWLTPPCNHSQLPVLITGTTRRKVGGRFEFTAQECRDASGLHWMTRAELDEAIPPAYTRWLGERLLETIRSIA